jgi:hypothetical protein
VAANECTSVTGQFNGHGGAPVRYGAHRLRQHDQGFTGNHWTPPSGNYSLLIAPGAARATINTTMMQHVPTLLAFLKAIAMRRYYTAQIPRWRRFVAFIKATKRRHHTSTCSEITNWNEKGLQLTCSPLIKIGVCHIKLMETT